MTNKKAAYIYLIITFFAWGSLYVVSKFVLGKILPFTVSLLRYFISITVLLFMLRKRNTKKIERQDYKYIFIIGFVGYFLSNSGQLLGTKLSNASFASVMIRKITQKYDPYQITTYGLIGAFICTLPVSAYEFITTPNIHFDFKVIIALLYMGVICSSLAHVLWNKSLSILEASTCSSFYPLQPMVSVLLGWMFLGEKINISFIFGAALIIGGVLFSIIGKEKVSQLSFGKSSNATVVQGQSKKQIL